MEGSGVPSMLLILLTLVSRGISGTVTLNPSTLNLLPVVLPAPAAADPLGISHDPNLIRFYNFYSSSNVSLRDEIVYNNISSLTNSHFQKDAKTVFIIHGFINTVESHFPQTIKNAYLETSLNYNYVIVDWGQLAISNNSAHMPTLCSSTSQLLRGGLGAHVSGNVGYLISQDNGGVKVPRITGLDPAGPGFFGVQVQRSLQPGDADFVDVYHTAMGSAGTIYAVGDVDFYPNGGITQPGCLGFDATSVTGVINTVNLYNSASCSHEFAANIYAATLSKNFTACQCNQFVSDLNLLPLCLQECPNAVLAGEPCPTSAIGQYYYVTSSNP